MAGCEHAFAGQQGSLDPAKQQSKLSEKEDKPLKPFLVAADFKADTALQAKPSQMGKQWNTEAVQSWSLSHSQGAALAAYGAKWRLGMNGLPKNARQVEEGYWLGAMPDNEAVHELTARNIKLVLTATYLDDHQYSVLLKQLNHAEIKHVYVPFGGKFPRRVAFWKDLEGYKPEEIYIHCEYGGDRSGAILAFLLATQHNWSIQNAFLAVAFPGKMDAKRLVGLLNKRGFNVEDGDIEQYLGVYSPEQNGGYGGLKVRSDAYRALIHTTIDAIERYHKGKGKRS